MDPGARPIPSPLSPPDSDSAAEAPESSRELRIRHIVEDCMARRAAGESLTDHALLSRHPDLLPELATELGLLALIERARTRSVSRFSALDGPPPDAAPLDSDSSPPGFDLVREIHRGGQGVVHEAIQRTTGRRVALKLRHEPLLPGSTSLDRFEREVEILAQLEHPNIVGVFDSGVHQGRPYFVMDYVDGQPLDEYLAALSPPPSPDQVLSLFEKIASAVAAAHVRGVIHRDLKPANILVDAQGQPRLVDFGLARLAAPGDSPALDSSRTITGQFLGSVPWASPEQADGDPAAIDVRSDVYSLGVVLFQMLTGRMPYALPSIAGGHARGGLREALAVITTAPPARPSSFRPGLDPDIDTIVLKCLSKEPARRYQSAAELAGDIRRFLEHRPIAARPHSAIYQLRRFTRRNRVLVAAAGAVALALCIGAVGTLAQLSRARAAERAAELRRADAERQSYIANIFAADGALAAGDGRAMLARLDAAPTHLRGWDWRYLAARADQSRPFDTGEPVAFFRTLGSSGRIAGLCRNGFVRCWDARTAQAIWSAECDKDTSAIAASADGRRLAVVAPDRVAILDTADGRIIRHVAPDRPNSVGCAALSADGSRLVLGCRDSIGILLFNTDSGSPIAASGELFSHVRSAELSPDDSTLVTIELPDVLLRDGHTLAERTRLSIGSARFGGRSTVRISPDGRTLAVSRIESIVLFELPSGRRIGELRGHSRFINDLDFVDDRTLLSCSTDATIRAWDLPTMSCTRTLLGHTEAITGLCADPRTGVIYSAAATEPLPRRWALEAGRAAAPYADAAPRSMLGFDGPGPGVLIDSAESILRQLPDGSPDAAHAALPIGPHDDVTLDRAGTVAAVLEPGGWLAIWDLAEGTLKSRVAIDDARSIAEVSTAGEYVALSPPRPAGDLHPSAALSVVETATSRAVLIVVPKGSPGVCRFVPGDGAPYLITVGLDGAIREWDIRSGEMRRTLLEPDDSRDIYALDLTPDRKAIIAGDSEGAVHRIRLADGELMFAVKGASPVYGLAVSPEGGGDRIAIGGEDGAVRILDARDGTELLTLRGHDTFVEHVEFSRDGRYLRSVSHAGAALLWDAPSQQVGGHSRAAHVSPSPE